MSTTPEQPKPQQQAASPRSPLTVEERLDLRRRVLSGYTLSLDEAKLVLESLRGAQGAAMLEVQGKKKSRSKKEAYADEALDKDLADLEL